MASTLVGETLGKIVTPVGHDGVNFRPLLVDASGRVVMYGPDSGHMGANLYGQAQGVWAPVQIHETGYLYVLVGSMPSVTVSAVNGILEGQIKNFIYDGSGWQPQRGDENGIAYADIQAVSGHTDAMAWHIKAPWRGEYTFTGTAGQKYVNSDTVSAGEIWVATNTVWWYEGGTSTKGVLATRGNAINPYVDRVNNPATGVYRITNVSLYLEAGVYIRATFENSAVGAILNLNVHGYKMYAS